MKIKKKPWRIVIIVFLFLIVCTGFGVYGIKYDDITIRNHAQIAEKIRQGLIRRSGNLTITFRARTAKEDAIKRLVDDLLEEALTEGDEPYSRDYLRYQMGGYELHYEMEKKGFFYNYTAELKPLYFTTRQEEDYVDEQVAAILTNLNLSDRSVQEKIRCVHDYLIDQLSYDQVHKENENSHKKATAYAALRYHRVSCQGYAVLCYRMLRELGIPCRIVTGQLQTEDQNEYHAWVAVTIDGVEYYMDPTLDDQLSCDDWYMKTADEFDRDHKAEPMSQE